MTLFRRLSTVSCFYCLSLIDPSHPSSSRAGAFDPSSFRCPYCGCWNRYDARGQIIGDEPAQYDERLNADSFSKRGLPDRNQLPSLAGQRTSSPFCRACQTNQTLLINLRAAYLPEPGDPSYAQRVAQLPTYIASLQTRYPPVCPSCQPAVDAEIAKKNEYARTRALGGALRSSITRPSSRAGGVRDVTKINRTRLRSWRIRGILWSISFVAAILSNAAGVFHLSIPSHLSRIIPVLPFLIFTSITWTFWDPTYSLQQKSQLQGRQVRVGGRQRYIFLQGLTWLSRLSTSILLLCSSISEEWDFLHLGARGPLERNSRRELYFGVSLTLELTVLVLSYFSITIHKPAPIRLIDTSVHRAFSEPPHKSPTASENNGKNGQPTSSYVVQPDPEPDIFASLSLSANPVITPTPTPASVNPMFGRPSLALGSGGKVAGEGNLMHGGINSNDLQSKFGNEDDYEHEEEGFSLPNRIQRRDPDAMDWEPASPTNTNLHQSTQPTKHKNNTKDDGTWLRQQRFFPPEEPTGLENLLMRTRLMDEDDPSRTGMQRGGIGGMERKPGRWQWHWGWVYSVSVLPVVAILVALWLRSRM